MSASIDILNKIGTEIDFAQTIPAKICLQPIQKFTPEPIPGWKQPPLSEKAQRQVARLALLKSVSMCNGRGNSI